MSLDIFVSGNCTYSSMIRHKCITLICNSDYYTPAMLGLKTDQEVLGELVKTKMPAVLQVMTRHNVTWGLVVSKWFICLYIDVLPMEVRKDP